MQRLADISTLQSYRAGLTGSVGFVPTMGALHAGHLSLIRKANEHNDHVIVSIFVNPTQFDQASDLSNYPKTLEQDLEQLASAGVMAVFMPDFHSVYPDDYAYQMTEKKLSDQFCGAHRPGHFDGVLSVVMKLLNLVKPHKAYFGEKDYQQLMLIQGMVKAFFMDVEIVSCPIIREADGLAMSSRNLRLTPIQRKIAPQLHAILVADTTIKEKEQRLADLGFELDYLSIYNNRLLAAASLGEVRLIDNVPYEQGGEA